MAAKKSTFDLRLNAAQVKEIHMRYDVAKPSSSKTTQINLEDAAGGLTFFDDTRRAHKCILAKIDFTCKDMYKCFWCRNSIPDDALGCPIKYVPSVAHRTYFSEINKEKFTVKQTILSADEINPGIEEISVESNDYYETDGIFCSFPCILAFARDNKKNPFYADSELLIHRIAGHKVDVAPHWRMLKEYGGTLDIREFRDCSANTEFINHGVYKPQFKSVSVAFEPKMRF